MSMDLSKIQAGSEIPGLQDLGPVDVSVPIAAFSIPGPGGTTSTRTAIIPFNRSDVFSLSRICFSGGFTYLPSYWMPLVGSSNIVDLPPGGTGAVSLIIDVTIQSDPQGRLVTVVYKNNFNNQTLNVPAHTILLHSHIYGYPW